MHGLAKPKQHGKISSQKHEMTEFPPITRKSQTEIMAERLNGDKTNQHTVFKNGNILEEIDGKEMTE